MIRPGGTILPVFTVVLAIVMIWYLAAVLLNAAWAIDRAEKAGQDLTKAELVSETLSQDRPRLPAPHQVVIEIWETTAEKKITSKRSLIYHGWVTLSATLLGFVFGAGLGMLLAVAIVHDRATDLSVMPLVIGSQTIPILALAPMIIVVLNAVGLSGLIPKAIISAYLSFFPVAVGMVSGFRSPAAYELDLMKTYNANRMQLFWKLRVPASTPFLFPSLKVAIAASLVGAIVGELPTGAVAGLGARLLVGSYYGQTVQIWSALVVAATLAAALVTLMGAAERLTRRAMGTPP
ncbi:MAG: ABC transporter permease [Paracoccaceae bacterium]|nr:ABC transporter permease [Paracoccaceae bacterium]MDE2912208.1 ABC transporter permease [Paracoccaceae bacterium]